jgi:hypothetical protein
MITGIYAVRNLKLLSHVSESIFKDHMLPMQHLTIVRYSVGTGLIGTAAKIKMHQITVKEAIVEVEKAESSARVNWELYLK